MSDPINEFQGDAQRGNGAGDAANWSQSNPFKLFEQALPARAKNVVRVTYGVIGLAAVLLGVALLVWPGRTLAIAAIILGLYCVVSGVMRIVGAVVEAGLPAGWRVLEIIVGLLLTVGGAVTIKFASLSGQTLALLITLTVGLSWMFEGIVALVESARLPKSGWAVLYAVISIIAGLIVLFSPLSATLWLIVFTSCALIVMGISAFARAFSFGRS